MKNIPDKTIDMILTDLPYGMTNCRWDREIPFEPLWEQYLRIIKDRGAICLFGMQPFTARIIQSRPKLFRYCWYWRKNIATNFASSKFQPLRCIEEICVFYKKAPKYNPQGVAVLDTPVKCCGKSKPTHGDSVYHGLGRDTLRTVEHYPKNLIEFKKERGFHPTQKPVALLEYLIRTYTDRGELVLDSCMGSGSTAIAAIRAGRSFIGFETDAKYYSAALERIQTEYVNNKFM
jgi:site-specific DNA-methyltransferase (adenine-specific)